MVDAVRVHIWDYYVGAVLWDVDRQLGVFEYAPEFVNEQLPISPLYMPAQVGRRYEFPGLSTNTYSGLPGLLADALPDTYGQQMINAWLARQGRSAGSMNPIERLSYVGVRGMGALTIKPDKRWADNRSQKLEVDELADLAADILAQRGAAKAKMGSVENMKEILRVGTSAGGARAKAVLAINHETGEVRSGQVKAPEGFAYWLMKFDGLKEDAMGEPSGYGRIEYAYYQMALQAGLEMSECRLYEEGDRAHFMTKRFDRNEQHERMHMQTLCGLAHMDYRQPLAWSYEQAFEVMRSMRLPYPDAEKMFRRMVFNVVARNQDDHTKNISFLMDQQGVWQLSPAYDVTYAYNPDGRWTGQHQLSVNAKRDDFTREDLLVVGKAMNIKRRKQILEEVIQAVAEWPKFAKEAHVTKRQLKAIGNTHRLYLAQ